MHVCIGCCVTNEAENCICISDYGKVNMYVHYSTHDTKLAGLRDCLYGTTCDID